MRFATLERYINGVWKIEFLPAYRLVTERDLTALANYATAFRRLNGEL